MSETAPAKAETARPLVQLFGRRHKPTEAELWSILDQAFHEAALECCFQLEHDPEIIRMSGTVLRASNLMVRDEAYRALEENIDRKIRANLAARERGSRFRVTGPAVTVVAYVCPKRRRLMATLMITHRKRTARQTIEASVEV
mgnify:CR=1 FL=1